jgi:hypothetical protein
MKSSIKFSSVQVSNGIGDAMCAAISINLGGSPPSMFQLCSLLSDEEEQGLLMKTYSELFPC